MYSVIIPNRFVTNDSFSGRSNEVRRIRTRGGKLFRAAKLARLEAETLLSSRL